MMKPSLLPKDLPTMNLTRTRAILLSALLFSTQGAMAQAVAQDCPPQVKVSPEEMKRLAHSAQPDRGPLWEISKDGHLSYLYGTIHLARLEWDFPGPTILKALRSARTVVVEMDITRPGMAATMLAPMPQQAADVSSPLYQSLLARTDQQLRKACADPENFKGASLASKMASLTLLSARRRGLYADFAIDAALIGFARYTRKDIIELEQPSDQRRVISQTQLASLERNLDDVESGKTEDDLSALALAWERGDMGGIAALCKQLQCQGEQQYYEERNKVFAAGIAKAMAGPGPTFIGVGFLHMLGPDSVIDQLRAMGFEVRQVAMSGKS